MEISPDGKHIAWIGESLWITDMDGSHRHALGRVPRLSSEEIPQFEGSVRWLPDSRHPSFIYHGALYVVPTGDRPAVS